MIATSDNTVLVVMSRDVRTGQVRRDDGGHCGGTATRVLDPNISSEYHEDHQWDSHRAKNAERFP